MKRFGSFLGSMLLIGVIGVGMYITPFAIGKWSNKADKVIGLESANIKREKFENSKSYVHGKIEDLQRYKRELERTKDVVERQAIIINIQDEFATFDESKIDNDNLRYFLTDIRNGNIE